MNIKILGHTIKVKDTKEELCGYYIHASKTIYINFKYHEESNLCYSDTLYHESLHAMLKISGASTNINHQEEETIVTCMEENTRNILKAVDKFKKK